MRPSVGCARDPLHGSIEEEDPAEQGAPAGCGADPLVAQACSRMMPVAARLLLEVADCVPKSGVKPSLGDGDVVASLENIPTVMRFGTLVDLEQVRLEVTVVAHVLQQDVVEVGMNETKILAVLHRDDTVQLSVHLELHAMERTHMDT